MNLRITPATGKPSRWFAPKLLHQEMEAFVGRKEGFSLSINIEREDGRLFPISKLSIQQRGGMNPLVEFTVHNGSHPDPFAW